MANFQQDILVHGAANARSSRATEWQIAMFAGFGVIAMIAAPSVSMTIAAVFLLSVTAVMLAGASIADCESDQYRSPVHGLIGAALLAMCLWLAISVTHLLGLSWGLHVAAAMAIFLAVMFAESVFSVLAAFAFGQLQDRDPAIAVAVLADRKYGGIAGKLV